MIAPSDPTPARFWEHVAVAEPDACWTWTAGRSGAGYGVLVWDGRCTYAHRLAWELHHGRPVPPGQLVRHAVCGNPLCVNVAHLATGTPADNSADMLAQGRHRNKALTPEQVSELRALAGSQRTVDLAARFGVTQHTIWQIVSGRTYRHLTQEQTT